MARRTTGTLPPPGNRSPLYDWPKIAKRLRRQPLRWSRVFSQGLYSTALSVKAGRNTNFLQSKGFEVTMRRVSADRRAGFKRKCDLWIRYRPDWDMSLSPEDRTRLMDQARKEQDAESDSLG